VVNAKSVSAGEDSDHVEAQGVVVWLVVGEVLLGEAAEGLLFTLGYGFEGVAEAGRAAELHFYEDEGVFVAYDQVDLSAARPVIAFDEPVAAPSQIAQRDIFPPRPGGLVRHAGSNLSLPRGVEPTPMPTRRQSHVASLIPD